MPGTPTQPDGLRWPVDTDTPDVPRDIKNLADDVQRALLAKGAPRFADAEARDTYYATYPKEEGALSYRLDQHWFEYWNGTVWQPFAGSLPGITLQFAPASSISTAPGGARFTLPVASIDMDSHPGAFTVNMGDGSVTLLHGGTYSVRGAFMSQGVDATPRTVGVDIGDLSHSVVPGIYAYSAPTSGYPFGIANVSVTGSAKWPAGQVVALWHAGDASFNTNGSSLRIQMTGA